MGPKRKAAPTSTASTSTTRSSRSKSAAASAAVSTPASSSAASSAAATHAKAKAKPSAKTTGANALKRVRKEEDNEYEEAAAMAVADPGKTTTHPVASKRARASSKNTSSSALTANQIPNPTSNSKRTTIDSSFSALVCAAWFDSFASSQDLNNQKQQLQQSQPSDEMDIEGILRFCDNASLDASGPVVLALAYHLKAQQMGVFTRAEWLNGMQQLDVDSTEKLARKLPTLERVFADALQCKELYKWAFNFAKESPEKKYIDVEIAKGLWRLILRDTTQYRHVDEFLAYLDDEAADDVKVINKDQWMSFYDFCSSVRADLSNYDESSAWPVILDEYVEWVREQ